MTDDCVHLLHNSTWKFHQLAARKLLSGKPVRYGKGRRYGPTITRTKSHLPGHSPPASHSGYRFRPALYPSASLVISFPSFGGRYRARICKPFKEPRNRFLTCRAGTTTRPGRLHRLAESIPRNRFLGSLNVYKYGLCNDVKGNIEK